MKITVFSNQKPEKNNSNSAKEAKFKELGLPSEKSLILIGDEVEPLNRIYFNQSAIKEMELKAGELIALGAAEVEGHGTLFTFYKPKDADNIYYRNPADKKSFSYRPAKLVVPEYIKSKVIFDTIDDPSGVYEIKFTFTAEDCIHYIVAPFIQEGRETLFESVQEAHEAPSMSTLDGVDARKDDNYLEEDL